MKRRIFLLGLFFVLFLAGCGQEMPDSMEQEPSIVVEQEPPEVIEPQFPDFITWTKIYLDAEDDFYEGGEVSEYETAISEFVGVDLLAEKLEDANESIADIMINGKIYTWEDKARLVFGKETRRVEMSTDLSPIYNDLNPKRDFFKYVFVRRTYKLYDENNELIPERSHIRLYKYWFQETDEEWKLYSVTELDGFPYDGEEHTRDFNEEPITFTHYKYYEIDLRSWVPMFRIQIPK